MSKWGVLGLIAGLSLLAIFAANKAKQAIIDGLNFISARVSKPSFQINQIVHTVQLTYRNSGPVSLFFDSFDGALYYGNYLLSYLSVKDRVELPAGAKDTVVKINGVIRYADLAGNILDLVKNKSYLNNLSVKGTVRIGGVPVPVDYPLQLI